MTEQNITDSVDAFEKAIRESQILMFAGGFSAGDEPDGSAKFITSIFRNEKIKDAVHELLDERDGLVLGICNGFQALIKLGLVPYGKIATQLSDSPTLTTNSIGRHVSKTVYTKWLRINRHGFRRQNLAEYIRFRLLMVRDVLWQVMSGFRNCLQTDRLRHSM